MDNDTSEVQQKAMISWLSGRSPDAWHAIAERLHPHSARNVLRWITNQPGCDLATAGLIFWKYKPWDLADKRLRAELTGELALDFDFLVDLISKLSAKFYSTHEFEFTMEDSDRDFNRQFEREYDAIATEDRAWSFPEEFMLPIDGRQPKVAKDESPKTNPELRALLESIGTKFRSLLPSDIEIFVPGTPVSHFKFGAGTIKCIDIHTDEALSYKVDFEHFGVKRIVWQFLSKSGEDTLKKKKTLAGKFLAFVGVHR